MKSLKSQNYYEVLGVARSASPEEIRNAYEVSRHTFQDDSLATYSLFTDEENHEILALISRAYETLFNPELRREYDAFLERLDDEDLSGREAQPNLQPRPQTLRGQAAQSRARGGSQGPVRPTPAGSRPSRDTLGAGTGAPASPARAAAGSNGDPEPEPEPDVDTASGQEEATEKYIETVSCYTGPVLKKIRQMRGLSREDIAERTKIRKTYIEYLEEEEFRFLPAPVYVKGFVTMIAGLLDLPAQRVADDYMAYYRGQKEL